jgi:quinol-cytochrome oxidoreductase complex cytochrome b subunit
VPFGDFVRGIHYWMANMVTLTVSLYLLLISLSGAYEAPREAN